MIPIHTDSVDYLKYRESYIKAMNKFCFENPEDSSHLFKDACCSLFHYSFDCLPNKQKGKNYTPAAIGGSVPKMFSKAVNEMVTSISMLGVLHEFSEESALLILSEPLYKEAAEQFLHWDATLVYRTLLKRLLEYQGVDYQLPDNANLEKLQQIFESKEVA